MDTRETLKGILEKGAETVFTVLEHVSRSGMSRSISLHVATAPGQMANITGMAAEVMGERCDRNYGGIKIGGCGMDMGFQLVYMLSSYLYEKDENGRSSGYHLTQHWL